MRQKVDPERYHQESPSGSWPDHQKSQPKSFTNTPHGKGSRMKTPSASPLSWDFKVSHSLAQGLMFKGLHTHPKSNLTHIN